MKEHTSTELASQPIGYWTGEAHRRIVGRIRSDLALEGLTQPHWWTLNHVAGAPGTWTRAALAERLQPFDDQGTDFEAVFDDLITRGWLAANAGSFDYDRGRRGWPSPCCHARSACERADARRC